MCHAEPLHGRTKHILVWENGKFLGDAHSISINPKYFRTWNGVLNVITETLKPSFGAVRNLVYLDSKELIKCFEKLEPNGRYVATGHEKVKFSTNSNCYKTLSERQKIKTTQPTMVLGCSTETQMRRTKTIIFIMANGKTCEMPCKVVVTESDMNSWDTILNFIGKSLDIPEGVPYLTTIYGERVYDPRELQNGWIYVAAPPSEKFVPLDYMKIFHQLLPMREISSQGISCAVCPEEINMPEPSNGLIDERSIVEVNKSKSEGTTNVKTCKTRAYCISKKASALCKENQCTSPEELPYEYKNDQEEFCIDLQKPMSVGNCTQTNELREIRQDDYTTKLYSPVVNIVVKGTLQGSMEDKSAEALPCAEGCTRPCGRSLAIPCDCHRASLSSKTACGVCETDIEKEVPPCPPPTLTRRRPNYNSSIISEDTSQPCAMPPTSQPFDVQPTAQLYAMPQLERTSSTCCKSVKAILQEKGKVDCCASIRQILEKILTEKHTEQARNKNRASSSSTASHDFKELKIKSREVEPECEQDCIGVGGQAEELLKAKSKDQTKTGGKKARSIDKSPSKKTNSYVRTIAPVTVSRVQVKPFYETRKTNSTRGSGSSQGLNKNKSQIEHTTTQTDSLEGFFAKHPNCFSSVTYPDKHHYKDKKIPHITEYPPRKGSRSSSTGRRNTGTSQSSDRSQNKEFSQHHGYDLPDHQNKYATEQSDSLEGFSPERHQYNDKKNLEMTEYPHRKGARSSSKGRRNTNTSQSSDRSPNKDFGQHHENDLQECCKNHQNGHLTNQDNSLEGFFAKHPNCFSSTTYPEKHHYKYMKSPQLTEYPPRKGSRSSSKGRRSTDTSQSSDRSKKRKFVQDQRHDAECCINHQREHEMTDKGRHLFSSIIPEINSTAVAAHVLSSVNVPKSNRSDHKRGSTSSNDQNQTLSGAKGKRNSGSSRRSSTGSSGSGCTPSCGNKRDSSPKNKKSPTPFPTSKDTINEMELARTSAHQKAPSCCNTTVSYKRSSSTDNKSKLNQQDIPYYQRTIKPVQESCCTSSGSLVRKKSENRRGSDSTAISAVDVQEKIKETSSALIIPPPNISYYPPSLLDKSMDKSGSALSAHLEFLPNITGVYSMTGISPEQPLAKSTASYSMTGISPEQSSRKSTAASTRDSDGTILNLPFSETKLDSSPPKANKCCEIDGCQNNQETCVSTHDLSKGTSSCKMIQNDLTGKEISCHENPVLSQKSVNKGFMSQKSVQDISPSCCMDGSKISLDRKQESKSKSKTSKMSQPRQNEEESLISTQIAQPDKFQASKFKSNTNIFSSPKEVNPSRDTIIDLNNTDILEYYDTLESDARNNTVVFYMNIPYFQTHYELKPVKRSLTRSTDKLVKNKKASCFTKKLDNIMEEDETPILTETDMFAEPRKIEQMKDKKQKTTVKNEIGVLILENLLEFNEVPFYQSPQVFTIETNTPDTHSSGVESINFKDFVSIQGSVQSSANPAFLTNTICVANQNSENKNNTLDDDDDEDEVSSIYSGITDQPIDFSELAKIFNNHSRASGSVNAYLRHKNCSKRRFSIEAANSDDDGDATPRRAVSIAFADKDIEIPPSETQLRTLNSLDSNYGNETTSGSRGETTKTNEVNKSDSEDDDMASIYSDVTNMPIDFKELASVFGGHKRASGSVSAFLRKKTTCPKKRFSIESDEDTDYENLPKRMMSISFAKKTIEISEDEDGSIKTSSPKVTAANSVRSSITSVDIGEAIPLRERSSIKVDIPVKEIPGLPQIEELIFKMLDVLHRNIKQLESDPQFRDIIIKFVKNLLAILEIDFEFLDKLKPDADMGQFILGARSTSVFVEHGPTTLALLKELFEHGITNEADIKRLKKALKDVDLKNIDKGKSGEAFVQLLGDLFKVATDTGSDNTQDDVSYISTVSQADMLADKDVRQSIGTFLSEYILENNSDQEFSMWRYLPRAFYEYIVGEVLPQLNPQLPDLIEKFKVQILECLETHVNIFAEQKDKIARFINDPKTRINSMLQTIIRNFMVKMLESPRLLDRVGNCGKIIDSHVIEDNKKLAPCLADLVNHVLDGIMHSKQTLIKVATNLCESVITDFLLICEEEVNFTIYLKDPPLKVKNKDIEDDFLNLLGDFYSMLEVDEYYIENVLMDFLEDLIAEIRFTKQNPNYAQYFRSVFDELISGLNKNSVLSTPDGRKQIKEFVDDIIQAAVIVIKSIKKEEMKNRKTSEDSEESGESSANSQATWGCPEDYNEFPIASGGVSEWSLLPDLYEPDENSDDENLVTSTTKHKEITPEPFKHLIPHQMSSGQIAKLSQQESAKELFVNENQMAPSTTQIKSKSDVFKHIPTENASELVKLDLEKGRPSKPSNIGQVNNYEGVLSTMESCDVCGGPKTCPKCELNDHILIKDGTKECKCCSDCSTGIKNCTKCENHTEVFDSSSFDNLKSMESQLNHFHKYVPSNRIVNGINTNRKDDDKEPLPSHLYLGDVKDYVSSHSDITDADSNSSATVNATLHCNDLKNCCECKAPSRSFIPNFIVESAQFLSIPSHEEEKEMCTNVLNSSRSFSEDETSIIKPRKKIKDCGTNTEFKKALTVKCETSGTNLVTKGTDCGKLETKSVYVDSYKPALQNQPAETKSINVDSKLVTRSTNCRQQRSSCSTSPSRKPQLKTVSVDSKTTTKGTNPPRFLLKPCPKNINTLNLKETKCNKQNFQVHPIPFTAAESCHVCQDPHKCVYVSKIPGFSEHCHHFLKGTVERSIQNKEVLQNIVSSPREILEADDLLITDGVHLTYSNENFGMAVRLPQECEVALQLAKSNERHSLNQNDSGKGPRQEYEEYEELMIQVTKEKTLNRT